MGTAEEGILVEDKTGVVNVASRSPAHRVSERDGAAIRNRGSCVRLWPIVFLHSAHVLRT